MIFSLAIYSAPTSQASYTAFRFASALIEESHTLYRVFFYHEAVHHASVLLVQPQDEFKLSEEWQQLAKKNKVDLVVCIAAALKRGILNEQESVRYEKPTFNAAKNFEISGLGQLVDAAIMSDRLITFGG